MNAGGESAGPGGGGEQIQASGAAHVKNFFPLHVRAGNDLGAGGRDAAIRRRDQNAVGELSRLGRMMKPRRPNVGRGAFQMSGGKIGNGRDVMA